MTNNNYLSIPASDRNRFIYRIVSVERLLELFNKAQNVLVGPKKWEDPFENCIFRSEQIFGQCWTLQSASDAMWRIYSPRSDAVRIRSTANALAMSLHQAIGKMADVSVFIGRVQYLREKKLIAFARTVRSFSPEMVAKTLLVKRPAFRHEREIRLLFVPESRRLTKGDLFPYAVDPHNLIDQIMIDPRMRSSEANKLKLRIVAETGFRETIKRSLLYAPPPDFLKFRS